MYVYTSSSVGFGAYGKIVHIWARNSGKRIAAKVPEGHLLVQAGKQLEWITGGLVKGEPKSD
jgi:hypothetical protein